MNEKIELKERKSQPVLSVRLITTLEELPNVIGENFHKIAAYMNGLGEEPVEVPFTAYHNLDMQHLDVEIGFPVSKVLPGKNAIKAGELPESLVVSYMYKGPYSGMEKVYDEIFRWMEDNSYRPAGVYYEYYFNSPDEVEESELMTYIEIPVSKK